jgi:uroporphyrinogen III methyltransferase/synthase
MTTTFPTVHLVGAGPGDPNLLTLAGAKALASAAVVIYDYLANPELLALAPPTAEKIYVGKSAGQHTLTQDQINQLLVDKAHALAQQTQQTQHSALSTQHSSIVRLKGGDPYVFGRGGEEAEFLHRHHIPFTIVPGITAGIAAPAYAGIPVTHRNFSTSVTLITAHEKEDTPDDSQRVNHPALAQLLASGGTLVFYMGVKSLPSLTQKLLAAGAPPETPAAVIRWGTRPDQQTLTAPLNQIAATVEAAKLKPPAITVIGQVVSLRPTLNFFESRPLFGQTILVTRSRQQASALAEGLAALGAKVLEAPTIQILAPSEEQLHAIDQTLLHLPAYDWILFTSANGVRATWQRLGHLGFDARHFAASNLAAVGPATADALKEIGLTPDLVPERNLSSDLATALQKHLGDNDERLAEKRFLLLRADIATSSLPDALRAAGATVDDLAVYQTAPATALPPEVLAALEADAITWTTFTSASTATNLHQLLPENLRQKIAHTRRASIGPQTSAALRALSWPPTIEAATHDIPTLLQAILAAATTPAPR